MDMPNELSILQHSKPRILIVDNDPGARISYQALLLEWGYDPVLAMGMGTALQEDALKKARENRCNLALIDLRLKDDDDEGDMSGADFAESIKTVLKPIILTGTEDPNSLRSLLQKHQDIPYIGKQDRRNDFRNMLDAVAAKVSAGKRRIEFINPELMDDFIKSDLVSKNSKYSDQVTDVLVQLFPTAEKLRFEKISGWAETSDVTSATRPNSIVLKVYEDNLEPCIIKLARAEKVRHEVRSYYEFISRKLTGSFNAQLLQSTILWDIGGAAYSFISGNNTRTFAAYYKDQPYSNIKTVLRSFFCDVWGKYYQHAKEEENISLFELYSQVWGEDWYDKCIREFNKQPPKLSEILIDGSPMPEPIAWLNQKLSLPSENPGLILNTKTAITHGDLHGDNLMVDDRKNVWVIDFERCGVGHALQDFIELEADIINRLLKHQINDSDYFQICLTAFQQKKLSTFENSVAISKNENVRKSLSTIAFIRELAFQCTKIDDSREYLFGLLFNLIFNAMLIHKKDPQKSRRPLLLAGMICHRLDHWDEPWPPTDWNFS